MLYGLEGSWNCEQLVALLGTLEAEKRLTSL